MVRFTWSVDVGHHEVAADGAHDQRPRPRTAAPGPAATDTLVRGSAIGRRPRTRLERGLARAGTAVRYQGGRLAATATTASSRLLPQRRQNLRAGSLPAPQVGQIRSPGLNAGSSVRVGCGGRGRVAAGCRGGRLARCRLRRRRADGLSCGGGGGRRRAARGAGWAASRGGRWSAAGWPAATGVGQPAMTPVGAACGAAGPRPAGAARAAAGRVTTPARTPADPVAAPLEVAVALRAERRVVGVLVAALPAQDHPRSTSPWLPRGRWRWSARLRCRPATTTSTVCPRWAGLAAATSASSRAGSTSDARGHRDADMQVRAAPSPAGGCRVACGPRGAAVLDHLDVAVGEHPDVVREAGQRAAPAMEVGGLGHERPPPLDGPGLVEQRRHPATQPVEEVGWRQGRVEIGTDVVDGRPDRAPARRRRPR